MNILKEASKQVHRTSVIYKITDPHNDLHSTLDCKILRGLFEHERLIPEIIRTNQGNSFNLPQVKP